MKAIAAVLIFVAGLSLGAASICAITPDRTPAPIAGDVQTCGTGPAIECGQYVLQINTQRGYGRFVLYRVTGSPIDTSTFDNVASGNPSMTYQAAEPDPRGAYTFTVNASEP